MNPKNYRVVWAIDVAADSPEHAATQARDMQTDPDSIATVFNVYERTKGKTQKPVIVDTSTEIVHVH